MAKRASAQTTVTDPARHAASAAWRRVSTGSTRPDSIEILKETTKTAAYRLKGAGVDGTAIVGKRRQTGATVVERVIYEEALPLLPIATLRYYGSVEESGGEFTWVFLEDAGEESYSPDDEMHRALAGRWLGFLHACVPVKQLKDRLPERGRAHYLERLRYSRYAILRHISSPSLDSDDLPTLRSIISQCNLVESRWGEVEEFCDRMPEVLVHGDFVKKNVRVRNGGREFVLLPFDWEWAGWGTPVSDFVSADVDMEAYWPIAAERWPAMSERDHRLLADFGVLFRTIAAISWDVPGLKSTSWLHHAMRNLSVYDARLAKIVRERGWSR